jgi:hypothetical protein
MPGLISPSAPGGGTEPLQFWNRALDSTVSVAWNGTLVPAPPGYSIVETRLGAGGLAEWLTRPRWLAAYRDDPRVQFAGRLVARSSLSRYALYRPGGSERAVWTSAGLQPDGAVLKGAPVDMTLNRGAAGEASAVTLTLRAAPGAERPVAWELSRAGRSVAAGELRPNRSRELRLPVSACASGERCPPLRWELRVTGRAAPIPLPVVGPPGAARSVMLFMDAARIEE